MNSKDISNARFAVLGAGMMGKALVYDLARSGAKDIVIADRDLVRARSVANFAGCEQSRARRLDVADKKAVTSLLSKTDVAISATTYSVNVALTKIAIKAKTHLCDLGGNPEVVDAQLALSSRAEKAGVTVVPDCGLAPGLAGVLVAHGFKQFDTVEDVRIRVGGLPQHPQPPLDYGLLFSVRGLINEYLEKGRILRNGRIVEVESLTAVEDLIFSGVPRKLEAFYTAGGTSTLPQTYAGRIRNLDYKTIRYAGHCEKIRLLFALGLAGSARISLADRLAVKPRAVLERLLETKLPPVGKDITLLQVTMRGRTGGRPATRIFRMLDSFDTASGLSSMMRTTAFPTSITAQMIASGQITARGVLPQERCVPTDLFLEELAKRRIRVKIL